MKTFVFERVHREEVTAHTEEEARAKLAQYALLESEFELIDVWSAEDPCSYCGKHTCEHKAQTIEHLRRLSDAASS